MFVSTKVLQKIYLIMKNETSRMRQKIFCNKHEKDAEFEILTFKSNSS